MRSCYGGGNGIGRAVAQAFARAGANVAVLDNNLPAAQATCAAISDGGALKCWQCDVASEDQVNSAIGKVLSEFSAIDILFNNAGVNRRKKLSEWTAEDWNAVISVNFIGSFCVARAVGQHMIQRRRGSIVNMSALGGGIVGLGRGTEIYTGTKGGSGGDVQRSWG